MGTMISNVRSLLGLKRAPLDGGTAAAAAAVHSLATQELEQELADVLATAAAYGVAIERGQAERARIAREAAEASSVSIAEPEAALAALEAELAPWTDYARATFGCPLYLLAGKLSGRIGTLREVLAVRYLSEGEPASFGPVRERLRKAVEAMADAEAALEGHRRRQAVLSACSRYLPFVASLTDTTALLQAVEQAREEYGAALAALRDLAGPDAA